MGALMDEGGSGLHTDRKTRTGKVSFNKII